MAEGIIGEFYCHYPDGLALHRNEPGNPPFIIGCHEHKFGHIRVLYASDTPGPDGRIGWWEKAWSPLYGDEPEGTAPHRVIGWRGERDHPVRGNGPDSMRWIPAGWRHEFTLLSATGYHTCVKFNREEDGTKVPYFTGHMEQMA